MAYSVMVWLVDPGEYPHEDDEETRVGAAPETTSGARTGVNVGYPIPRMVYGVYENQHDADRALEEISNKLQQNSPLRLDMHGNRSFLIPAERVHYVVCDEVTRPKDEQ